MTDLSRDTTPLAGPHGGAKMGPKWDLDWVKNGSQNGMGQLAKTRGQNHQNTW